ncbi:MAG: T9SS type A sorting domain-containing protein [Crocinitomicaceae bacterium]
MEKCLVFTFVLFIQCTVLNAQDGILDNSFDSDGIVTMDINSSNDVMKSIITQPDGKIIVAGYTSDMISDQFCVVRFNSDGSLDNSFGLNGVVTTPFPFTSVASDMALQANGKIIVAGHTWSGTQNNFALARYNADGSLDVSFGNSGLISTSIISSSAIAKVLEIQNDGKIIVGGTVMDSPPDGSSLAIVRYNQNGTLDNTFGIGGVSTTDVAPGFGLTALDIINDLIIQLDGKMVVCGNSGPDGVLLRYNTDGSLDSSFGLNGVVIENFSASGMTVLNGVDIQQGGKIVAVGFVTGMNGFSDMIVTRYITDGSLDTSFGSLGLLTESLSPSQDGAQDICLQQDGKILVAGNIADSIYNFGLVRYHPDGSTDSTFGSNGVAKTAINAESSYLHAIAIQTDGKILATGSIGADPTDLAIVRYSSTVLSVKNSEIEFENVMLYPNPTLGPLNISFIPKQAGGVSLKLFDCQGRLLEEKLYRNAVEGEKKVETLRLESYSTGVYFISIISSNTQRTFKVIKK